ncbi:Phosphate-binding protein PstS [Neomoorella glycerini]|uniref:Phosphate-binding protein n=2 Tax=Neomoorella glycerini TaxID=55779 RepID=A0A6I5ZQT0_9FIRM|nr:phosphate ABC transporter substrate-binding protein PstS [Moorella glycerini]QGP92343.1 Phosphate-binding protein PstS [Moorella glycerini]
MPRKKSKWVVLLVLALALVMMVAACGKSRESSQAPAGSTDSKTKTVALNGAGASFPYPLYSKWIAEYRKVAPSVTIDYQSIGSGGGIKGITEETVDFAGSDAPMKDDQLARAPEQIFHIPTVMGAVVITYNLAGVKTGLKLTPEVISGIYLGNIKKWNDPAITSINPDVKLPEQEITVVHRSDGSGTTNIFTDYLSNVSKEWKEKVGKGTSVEWPVGIGAKGNEGVAGTVKQTPGGIGYVELAYAVQNQLPYAFLKNQAGKFVEPTLDTTTAAAAGSAANMPEDMRVSIVNAPGENSYPIAGYTYLLVYKDQKDKDKGTELVKFLWWAIHDGEKYAKDLLYAPLPDNVVKLAEARIKQINYQGESLYK